jgi:pilus assembly protein CpaB
VSIMRIVILVVAGGAALIAAMMVRNMSNQPAPAVIEIVEEKNDAPQVPLVQVLVASTDLPLGHRIAPSDLTWLAWPEEGIDERFMTEETSPEATTELAGAVVRMPMFSGEPILDQKIISVGERSIMAAVLNEGMRAVAVEISVETAAGGFILPNDRVDVILSYTIEVTEGDVIVERPATRTILQNVRVLAIDQSFREIEGEDVVVGTTATLELRPEHAEILMLGTQMGDVSLTLRGVHDVSASGMEVIATSDIESAKDISGTVKIYRSGQVEKATVGGNP